jgi:hypothetical protein
MGGKRERDDDDEQQQHNNQGDQQDSQKDPSAVVNKNKKYRRDKRMLRSCDLYSSCVGDNCTDHQHKLPFKIQHGILMTLTNGRSSPSIPRFVITHSWKNRHLPPYSRSTEKHI